MRNVEIVRTYLAYNVNIADLVETAEDLIPFFYVSSEAVRETVENHLNELHHKLNEQLQELGVESVASVIKTHNPALYKNVWMDEVNYLYDEAINNLDTIVDKVVTETTDLPSDVHLTVVQEIITVLQPRLDEWLTELS